MTPHSWQPIKLKNTPHVIAWECSICKACAGRHSSDLSEDRPAADWLEITGIGEFCKDMDESL